MTLALTQENQELLQQAAASTHRSESEIVNEAMHWYLSNFAELDDHREKIARARQQIAEGRTIPHEEVFAQLKQRMGW